MAKDVALIKKNTVDVVANRIRQFQETGELHLPVSYSAENAIKTAWLQIQETVNINKQPALDVCTRESIANALLYMVTMALNPAKNQCYFLVYGNKLACQRSYFGSMSLARMLNPTKIPEDGFSYAVVYEKDELEYEIKRGKSVIVKHCQKLGNINKDKILAAYCEIYDENDRLINSELMTMEEIKQSWKQSKQKPILDNGKLKAGSVHDKFTTDMALRTVINKACKPIINSSNDSQLMMEAIRHADEIQTVEDVQAEVDENANQEIIDIVPEETASEPETEPEMTQEEIGAIKAQEAAEAETTTDDPY